MQTLIEGAGIFLWPQGFCSLAALFLLPLAWQVWAIASRNRPRLFRLPDAPPGVLP